MQLQLVRAARETRQFEEIVDAFTPLMRRICPHLGDGELRQMIERMALQQLADDQRRSASPRAVRPRRPRPVGTFPQLRAC